MSSELEADSPQPSSPHLVICANRTPVQCALNGSIITLGRSAKNLIQIDRQCVSFRHLEFYRTATDGYQLIELGSQNGTTVNGISTSRCHMNDGDRIIIGNEIIVYYLVLPEEVDGTLQVDVPDVGDTDELEEFHHLNQRIESLEVQKQLLARRMRMKTGEYENLLNAIVRLKTDPGEAFREIYGEGEIPFPVRFHDRISVPNPFERDEGSASIPSEVVEFPKVELPA